MNTTLLTYAALIVGGGAVAGLVLYYLATTPAQSGYGQYSQYSNNYYSQARMLRESVGLGEDWDLLGLVSQGLNLYRQLNGEEEED